MERIILDVDSTLCGIEGIDWLAQQRGVAVCQRVSELTDRAMAGVAAMRAGLKPSFAEEEGIELALIRVARVALAAAGIIVEIDGQLIASSLIGEVLGDIGSCAQQSLFLTAEQHKSYRSLRLEAGLRNGTRRVQHDHRSGSVVGDSGAKVPAVEVGTQDDRLSW